MSSVPHEQSPAAGSDGAPPSSAAQPSRAKHLPPLLPSGVDGRVSIFDRFADAVGAWVSRAWFFSLCVAVVVLWLPSILLLKKTWTRGNW